MHAMTAIVLIDRRWNARMFQDDNIQPVLIPHVRTKRGMCLAQDNAPCHVARGTPNILTANRVCAMPLSAVSPDLIPFENV